MSLLKKVTVLAVIMAALIIPVAALSENAAGEASLRDNSVWVSKGFDDRTAGTVTVRVFNTESYPVQVSVSIVDIFSGATYASGNVTVPGNGSADLPLSFKIGAPGTYHVNVMIKGADVSPIQNQISNFEITVGRSIWSNTWTYIAIVIVLIIVGIFVFLRMRSAPKVDNAGEFTAMEAERKAGKKTSGAKKEEYKGRSKK